MGIEKRADRYGVLCMTFGSRLEYGCGFPIPPNETLDLSVSPASCAMPVVPQPSPQRANLSSLSRSLLMMHP
jgi:hypothetical protein